MKADAEIVIVGAGAAGLTAAIFAARAGAESVVVIDGARRIGSKILISGGGRCNVTHREVAATDFNGSRNAIARILRELSVPQTIEFFSGLGVELKEEETGKLFPVTDSARTVLESLLSELGRLSVTIREECRVETIEQTGGMFGLQTTRGLVTADTVILATGGRSIPKTGSDGHGYRLAASLGHSITPLFPALVPLITEGGFWGRELSGLSCVAELRVEDSRGKQLHRSTGSLLFTHFGLSGPLVLDVSRHWIAARRDDDARLLLSFLPGVTPVEGEGLLLRAAEANRRSTVLSWLRESVPDRLAIALAAAAGSAPDTRISQLTRELRSRLARAVTSFVLPVIDSRGFDYAEVTAGGVPLDEVELKTLQSRRIPGLFLCGEILDVDGRIGGFNFQWAWCSGKVAGEGAAGHQRAKRMDVPAD